MIHMTQFILLFRVLEITTQLLEVGADASTTHEARRSIDSLVADFEESQGVVIEEDESEELKEYFQVIENLQSLDKILGRGLPSLLEADNPELAQLRAEIFATINDLLKAGITSCNLHVAHIQLDAILEDHEQFQANCVEESGISALDHLFPNLEEQLNALTIFSK